MTTIISRNLFRMVFYSRPRQPISIIALFLFFLFSFNTANASTTWYVNDNSTSLDIFTTAVGNDTSGNGSASRPYLTLAKAIAMSVAGDTIYIDSGTYVDDSLALNKANVTFIGAGSSLTVFDGPATPRQFGVISANGITIKNMTFTSYFMDSSSNGQIMDITGATGVLLEGIVMKDCLGGTNSLPNLNVQSNANVTVKNSLFKCSGYNGANGGGIVVNSATISVQNCTFFQNESHALAGGGIAVKGTSTVTVSGSTFEKCKALNGGAISQVGSSSLTVTGCSFKNNTSLSDNSSDGGGAIYVTGSVVKTDITNCTFTNNSVTNNSVGVSSADGGAIKFNACSYTGGTGGPSGTFGFTISKCSFTNNGTSNGTSFPSDKGQDIYLDAASLKGTISNCSFSPAASAEVNIGSASITQSNFTVSNNGVYTSSGLTVVGTNLITTRTDVAGATATGWTDSQITGTTTLTMVNALTNYSPIRTGQTGFGTWTDTSLGGAATNVIMTGASTARTPFVTGLTMATAGGWTQSGTALTGTTTNVIMKFANNTFVSPTLDFSVTGNEYMIFEAAAQSSVNATKNLINVYISTNGGTNWSLLGSRTPTSVTSTQMARFDLSSYSGSTIKIKFETPNADGTIGAALDNINIYTVGTVSSTITPSLDLSATTNLKTLSFSSLASNSSAVASLYTGANEVLVSISTDGGSNYSPLQTIIPTATAATTTIDLSSYSTSTVKIKFETPYASPSNSAGTTGQVGATLDDIKIYKTDNSKTITPSMDFSGKSVQLSYTQALVGSNATKNTVTVSVSIDGGSNYTAINTSSVAGTYILDLSAYTSANTKVKFETLSADGTIGASIDNVSVVYATGATWDASYSAPNATYFDTSKIAACGSSIVCASETNPPVILTSVTNKTVSSCSALLDYRSELVAYDDCSITSIVQSPAAGATLTAGVNTITITVTDTAGNQTTSSFTVTAPTSIGGSISGGTTVCSGTNSTLLTLSGNSGSVTKWQSSTASDFSLNVIDIANTTTTLTATNLTATTYYRAVTSNGGCASANSSNATISVDALSVGGTVSGSTSVCAGANSTTLSLAGKTGNVTKWQYSSDNFASDINDVANTTTSLTATNLNTTTYYRVVVTNGTCASANSAIATITVDVASVGGTISGSTSVCTGTNSTTLSLTGKTGNVTKWQYSSDNFVSDSHDLNFTTTSLTISNLTSTTYYRAVVTNGTCWPDNSSSAIITVNEVSVGGSISGGTSVCTGTNSTTLSLTGKTGNVTKWQYSSDNFASDSHDVANTTTSLTASDLTSTTYYRAVVTNGTCSSANSLIATITVDAASVGGSVSGSTSVCAENNSTNLSLTGNIGTITKWQYSSDNFASDINDISNTSTSLNASDLTSTTYYRAVITNGTCSSSNSASATITVNDLSVGGSVTGGTSVCTGTNSTALSLTGNTGNVVKWQYSSNNFVSDVHDISNSTTSLTATNLTSTTYYRAVVKSGTCSSANSASTSIAVNPISNGGSISSDVILCSETNSTNLSISGYTGSVVKWQSSTSSDFSSNVTDIANTTASLTATDIASTTYFRAVVANGSCATANSPIVTLTNAPSVGGYVLGSTSLCTGTNSASLSLTGNVGSVTKWQSSTASDFSSNVTDINNTTTGLSVSNLTVTTYYRAVVQSGTCSVDTSDSASLSINPVSAGGTVSGGKTLLSGINSVTLTLTGYTGDVIKWQSSTASDFSSNVTDITNITSSLTVTNLNVTTYYRAVVQSGTCSSANSNIVTITVILNGGGTTSGTTALCSATNSTTLTLTGNMGSVVKWQSSTVSNFTSNVVDITNTTTSLTVTNLTTTKYYRALVSLSGVQNPVSSSVSTITYANVALNIQNIYGPTDLCGLTSASFGVPVVVGATKYTWTFPAGLSVKSSGGNEVLVNIDPLYISGTITVRASNDCPGIVSDTKSISPYKIPLIATITGPTSTCGITTATYTATALADTSYAWTLPTGMTITDGDATNVITVAIDSNFTGGNIACVATNSCGVSNKKFLGVSSVDGPSNISGPQTICGSATATYTTAAVSGVSSYVWTVSNGMTIASGQGTNTITVSFENTFSGGEVTVALNYGCGFSNTRKLTIGVAQTPGAITGPRALCGLGDITYDTLGNVIDTSGGIAYYSIVAVYGALSYVWTVPNGVTIISGQGTTRIGVSFDYAVFSSGTIYVQSQSACGTSPLSFVNIKRLGGNIIGLSELCNVTTARYYLPFTTGSNFRWTVPSWMTITSGQDTSDITVNIIGAPCSDTLRVDFISNCDTPENFVLTVGCSQNSKLIASSCGATVYSENALIYANAVTGATLYKFKVNDGSQTQYIERSSPSFSLSNFTGWTNGTTYTISVAPKVSGAYLAYGCSCSVTLSSPKSQLVSSVCGTTLASLYSPLYANAVAGATKYKFEVSYGTPATVKVYETTTNSITLSNVVTPVYGTTYSIRIAVKTNVGSGQAWQDYGSSCTVTTPAPTTTKLIPSLCGATITSLYTNIYCTTVPLATSYKFSVTDAANVERIKISNTPVFNLMQFPGGAPSYGTYTIKVAVLYNGTWQDYGAECSLTATVPTSQLVSALCGSTLTSVSYPLYATTVNLATGYRFEVSTGGSIISNYDATSNVFNLLQISGINYSTTYSIRVAPIYNGTPQAFGASCTVTTPAIATTQLVASVCGSSLTSLYAPLYANVIPLASGYSFEVSSGGTVIGTYNSSSNVFNLMQLSNGAQYSTSYSVRVAPILNGTIQAFGASCTITTPALGVVKLLPASCGASLTSLYAPISCNAVPLATGYQFEVSDGVSTRNYNSSSNTINLMQIPEGAQYGTTYTIRVAPIINGTLQPFGDYCNVTTLDVPTTQVVASRCGTTLTSLYAPIYANTLTLATGYAFKVIDNATGLQVGSTYSSAVNVFNLKQISGTTKGKSYSISVAIQYNGSWQGFGPSCTVITAAYAIGKISDESLTSVFNVKAYPNPFETSFNLAIESSSDDQIEVTVYDMIGRELEARKATVSELSTQELGNNYPSGVYNIIVSQGDQVKTLRMIKR